MGWSVHERTHSNCQSTQWMFCLNKEAVLKAEEVERGNGPLKCSQVCVGKFQHQSTESTGFCVPQPSYLTTSLSFLSSTNIFPARMNANNARKKRRGKNHVNFTGDRSWLWRPFRKYAEVFTWFIISHSQAVPHSSNTRTSARKRRCEAWYLPGDQGHIWEAENYLDLDVSNWQGFVLFTCFYHRLLHSWCISAWVTSVSALSSKMTQFQRWGSQDVGEDSQDGRERWEAHYPGTELEMPMKNGNHWAQLTCESCQYLPWIRICAGPQWLGTSQP